MNPKVQNLIIRAISGVVYAGGLSVCAISGPIPSMLLFSAISAGTLWEFAGLMNQHQGTDLNRPILTLGGVILSFAVWGWSMGLGNADKMFGLYAFTLLYLIVSELYRQTERPIANWMYTLASQLYIAVPFALLPLISINAGHYTFIYVLALFVFLWTNDTGAYLTGTTLHNVFPAKLFPRISPNKSWIGSIGGGVLTLAVSLIFAHFDPFLNRLTWMGMALVVVVFGTWGDLVESLMKRQLGIKDSGNVLPGHGGMLDRFDSALLTIPAVILYFVFIG